ncbi:MAG: ImmA/IrrE family metallo-endopeptidase [Actinomycetes bacterium]
MTAQAAPVTPAVLAWAVAEDGRPLVDIAERLKVTEDVLDEWLAGESQPTRGQVTKLAEVLKRPRALFFLPRPPEQATLPATFRHPPGDDERDVGAQARRRVRQARRVQHAVSWALRNEQPVEVPLAMTSDSPEASASRAREWLGVTIDEQRAWRDEYEALRAWREALDERGVLVFALEIGRDDVRGFSAWDDHAPLIVVNTSAVNPAARIFTMAHELGHLVTRQDAACIDLPRPFSGATVERWCEQFGAALLMPPNATGRLAHSRSIGDGEADLDDVKAVATAFRVSHRAAALRLIDLGYAERSLYADVLRVFRPKPPEKDAGRKIASPPRPTLRIRQYGPRTLRTVLSELPPRDALSMLRVTVEDARRIADEVPGVPSL